jgi:hypothetical protein
MRLRLIAALAALAVVAALPASASAARTLTIGDATAAEPAAGAGSTAKFEVTLSKPNKKKSVTVDYKTAVDTAGVLDFEANAGEVKIKPKKDSAKIEVEISADLFAEPDEEFTVKLSNPKRAELDENEGTGLIPENDQGADTDGDLIPDADDCDPADANPPEQLECFVPTTIYDVNSGAIAPGTNAYIEEVFVGQLARGGRSAWAQILPSASGYAGQDFSGIELDTAGRPFAVSENFVQTLIGVVGDGKFKVYDATDDVCCSNPEAPIPFLPAAFALGPDEEHGQLVAVSDLTIDSTVPDGYVLEEGFRVSDDYAFDFPRYGPGTEFESITGWAETRGSGDVVLYPRDASDIDPVQAKLTGFVGDDTCLFPTDQDVNAGVVLIDEAQATDTVIAIENDSPDVISAPSSVTVLAGQTFANVSVDALGPEGDAELTASLGPVEDEVFVQVSDDFC